MRDIRMVLERWGTWVTCDTGSLYYAPVAAGFKGVLPSSRKSGPSCCDSDGLAVSSAVNMLKNKDAYLHALLERYYVNRMTLRSLENRLGISRNTVLMRLMSAEGYVEGYLDASGVRLEMDRDVERV